jgi:succinoglycan biosynthesis transport protein ExoP
MTLLFFVRLLARNWAWVLFPPLLLAGSVFFLTRDQPREYATTSLIYTGLASGYSLESGEQAHDRNVVMNAFSNLINTVKARTTLEEVSLRLLAQHLMLRQPDPSVLSAVPYEKLQEAVPPALRRRVVDYGSVERTVANLHAYSLVPRNELAEKLLTGDHSPYSPKAILGKLTVQREGDSDILKMSYVAHDPAVVKRTLEILTEVFTRRYRELKVSETGSASTYFEDQFRMATDRLAASENRMKDFSRDNRIINYPEQTKYISALDSDIDFEIQRIQGEYEASRAAMAELDTKLKMRSEAIDRSTEVTRLRDSLSSLHSRLTVLELRPDADALQIRRTRQRIEEYESRARAGISQLYDVNHSPGGVPVKPLFDQWIDAFVNVDKGKARLKVLTDFKKSYDRFYDQFAPLGSNLSKLQREISVAEREYLEILHSLNLSKLREQNLLLSTSLKVLDPPQYPGRPEPSKRMLLVVGSFLVGALLVLATLLGREYFDGSLKNPQRAARQIGLPFIGALPRLGARAYRHETIERLTMQQAIARIRHLTAEAPHRPVRIALTSVREGEGKTHALERLLVVFGQSDLEARLIDPEADTSYWPTTSALEAGEYGLYELPALLDDPLAATRYPAPDLTLVVADARRRWNKADAYLLDTFREGSNHPVGFLLNRVQPIELEEIIGEVPRRRSWLRRSLKRLFVTAPRRAARRTARKPPHQTPTPV